jgi:tetratricopeptide (TPR) repeat protein
MRPLYVMGLAYAAVCGVVALKAVRPVRAGGEPARPAQPYAGQGGEWFQLVKPYCNALEVVTRIRSLPPPAGRDGAGYAASCYALAGNIDSARAMILALSANDRGFASSIVFNIGHPVADAGDDRSAGPIMELVLEFWPDNYMALYHAGISESVLGQSDKARASLRRFLELYHENDGWRANALTVLGRLEGVEK